MTDTIKHMTTREGYNRWAPAYDSYDNPLIALEGPIVVRLMGEPRGLRVADIGCGTGRHSLPLARAGNQVTGVDFSTRMLDQLSSKLGPDQLALVEHDLQAGIPLESDAFDLVLCCLVIEHIAELQRFMAELTRICRPGGAVVISDLHPEMVRRGFHARFREAPGGTKFQMSGACHWVSDYVMAAVSAGLQISEISEHMIDEQTAARSESARKWRGLPFLLVARFEK